MKIDEYEEALEKVKEPENRQTQQAPNDPFEETFELMDRTLEHIEQHRILSERERIFPIIDWSRLESEFDYRPIFPEGLLQTVTTNSIPTNRGPNTPVHYNTPDERALPRQTGRTTRLILSALYELSEGRLIVFVMPNRGMCRWLRVKVETVLQTLGMLELFRRNIEYITPDEEERIRGRRATVYYDHTVE